MNVVAWFLAGLAAGLIALFLLRPVLASAALARTNYRGHTLATAGGIVLVIALVGLGAVWALVDGMTDERGLSGAYVLVLFAAVGFGFLGMLDDLVAGEGDVRGFKGHVRALLKGQLTTGGVKLFGGGVLALVLVGSTIVTSPARLIVDGAIVALGANLGNLFDRAPGRVIKFSFLAYIPLALVAGTGFVGEALAPVMGAALALAWADQREELMLGDTGANVLGGVLALGATLVLGASARLVLLAALIALNAASELVSFSKIIDAVPPLRWFDRLGRVSDAAS